MGACSLSLSSPFLLRERRDIIGEGFVLGCVWVVSLVHFIRAVWLLRGWVLFVVVSGDLRCVWWGVYLCGMFFPKWCRLRKKEGWVVFCEERTLDRNQKSLDV